MLSTSLIGFLRRPVLLLSPRRRPLSSEVLLTSARYPDLKRRSSFSEVSEADLKEFRKIVGEQRVITDQHDLEAYNTDWLRSVRGQSRVLLKPRDTGEVSSVLSHCHRRSLAICPQGGNTGLVGGSVPVFDEIVVSTELMNKIESLDENSSVVTVQAGVILEQLDQFLASKHLMVPWDLGAKGSCHIGGNVSTNAGGIRLLRYGSLHGSILGIEAVLPNGEVLDCLSSMKKDNTGYDLKQLFIGSEGTLGLVTRVTLQCPPRPKAVNVALLGLENYDHVLDTFKMTRSNLGEILSSCEFMDSEAMTCVTKNLSLDAPIDKYPMYLLIETSGASSEHDQSKLEDCLHTLMSSSLVCDGVIAKSESQIKDIWSIREKMAEALLRDGYCYKYDISLPLDVFYNSVIAMRERVRDTDAIRCVGYGHIGDGNMHLNITSKQFDPRILDKIEPFLFEFTRQHGGSISAEHGLGFKKRNFIHFSKSKSAVNMMKRMKDMVDPKGIMNPYKVLPEV